MTTLQYTALPAYGLLCVFTIAHVCRSRRDGLEKGVWILGILAFPIGGCLSYAWDCLSRRRR